MLSQYLEGLHSPTTTEMEIVPTHINEELNASTMDFQQMTKRWYPLAIYNIKSSKKYVVLG